MNIVWCVLDSLRADHLGCYGYPRNTSPNLDKLASDGVRFEACHANATFTLCSHASMFTGTSVVGHNNTKLSPSLKTIAECFQEHGYKTGTIMSNLVTNRLSGLDRGFEVYDDKQEPSGQNTPLKSKNAKQVVDAGISFIQQNKDKKFFLFLQFMDTHGPYKVDKHYSSRYLKDKHYHAGKKLPFSKGVTGYRNIPNFQRLENHRHAGYYMAQYDGCISYADEHIGRLHAFLKEQGMLENTLLVAMADHGESMGEHDHWFCHGVNLYNEQTHIPLLFTGAGMPSTTVTGVVGAMDVFPTFLELAGIPIPAQSQGNDLRPAIESGESQNPVFMEMEPLQGFSFKHKRVMRAVRTKNWKLIRTKRRRKRLMHHAVRETGADLWRRVRTQGLWLTFRHVIGMVRSGLFNKSPAVTQPLELYNLRADPGETENLTEQFPQQLHILDNLLKEWTTKQQNLRKGLKAGGEAKMDAERQAQFKGLGYL